MKETIKTLKAYKKFINGKGKKYPVPGAPDVNNALDVAIEELSLYMTKEDFTKLVELASLGIAGISDKEGKKNAKALVKRGFTIVKKFSKEG